MSDHNVDPQSARSADVSGPARVRAAVIDAARTLFAERGIHAVSVREIAREVGVSHTLLHLYFGSKEEILRQVLASATEMDAGLAEEDRALTASEFVYSAFVANAQQLRVLAAAIMEGFVPDKIAYEPVISKQLARKLEASGALAEGIDAAQLTAVIASSAIGWAVAGSWLGENFGVDESAYESAMKQMLGHVVEGSA